MHYLNSPQAGHRQRRWGRIAGVYLALAALLAPQPSFAASSVSLEKAVKASFLFKFAPFIEWPPTAFTASDRNFMICVIGDDPFGNILPDVLRGQKIGERPVTLRRLPSTASPAGCHILYAGRSTDTGYAPFGALGGQPILTVTDRNGGPSGAMIEFVMQSGRVRFQIDDSAARANGLKISSKLLGLAIAVNRK